MHQTSKSMTRAWSRRRRARSGEVSHISKRLKSLEIASQTVPELFSAPAARVQPQHEQHCAAPALAPGCPQGVAAPRWARACPTQGSVSQAGGAEVRRRAHSRGAGRNAV
jgi:hypothetical protein